MKFEPVVALFKLTTENIINTHHRHIQNLDAFTFTGTRLNSTIVDSLKHQLVGATKAPHPSLLPPIVESCPSLKSSSAYRIIKLLLPTPVFPSKITRVQSRMQWLWGTRNIMVYSFIWEHLSPLARPLLYLPSSPSYCPV